MSENASVRYCVMIVTNTGTLQGELDLWNEAPQNDEMVQITLTAGERVFSAQSEDGFFFALQNVRKQLDAHNIAIACTGSCLNVYPSPMTARMDNGEMAYRLPLERPAQKPDLVNIFEPCKIDEISSVSEQDNFYVHWLESLRKS
ncbi:MAG: hypothetical protein R3B94_09325 [Hyphomonas sp.]